MKLARYAAIGTGSSFALAALSFLVAPGTWLTTAFIAPGALAVIAIAWSCERLLPPSVVGTVIDFAGEGRGAFVGATAIAACCFWAVAIGLGAWWVGNAPENDA